MGNETRVCEATATWNNTVPTCQIKGDEIDFCPDKAIGFSSVCRNMRRKQCLVDHTDASSFDRHANIRTLVSRMEIKLLGLFQLYTH